MPTKAERVLGALGTLLGGLSATVERNIAVPVEIPEGGLVVLRDGDPGEPERVMGASNCYYQHQAEIELYVADGDAAERDNKFDVLAAAVGGLLESDTTLGGLVFGMTYGRPDAPIEAVEGGEDIKSGFMPVVLDYETASPLG